MMKVLVVVDVQNDFCPGGALAVEEGDEVVPVINRVQPKFDMVVATQDWHSADHSSFATNHPGRQVGDVIALNGHPQVLWPVHCVQGTAGAQLRSDLDMTRVEQVFQKGMDVRVDSYSGFFDNDHKTSSGLGDFLRDTGTREVFVAGLATDYCVKFTALDARRLGFDTTLILDACRGVNLQPDDVDKAVEEMRAAGVRIVTSEDI